MNHWTRRREDAPETFATTAEERDAALAGKGPPPPKAIEVKVPGLAYRVQVFNIAHLDRLIASGTSEEQRNALAAVAPMLSTGFADGRAPCGYQLIPDPAAQPPREQNAQDGLQSAETVEPEPYHPRGASKRSTGQRGGVPGNLGTAAGGQRTDLGCHVCGNRPTRTSAVGGLHVCQAHWNKKVDGRWDAIAGVRADATIVDELIAAGDASVAAFMSQHAGTPKPWAGFEIGETVLVTTGGVTQHGRISVVGTTRGERLYMVRCARAGVGNDYTVSGRRADELVRVSFFGVGDIVHVRHGLQRYTIGTGDVLEVSAGNVRVSALRVNGAQTHTGGWFREEDVELFRRDRDYQRSGP